MVEFPNRIRELRQKKGWTTEQLATVLGSTHATVSRLEQGKQALTSDWIYRIALALSVRPADILNSDNTVTFAYWRGDMRLNDTGQPLYEPDQVEPIPVPLFDPSLKGKELDAFQVGDTGWVIAEPSQGVDPDDFGKTFVLLIREDDGWEQLSVRTLQNGPSGPAFIAKGGDWIRFGDTRIKAIWHTVADFQVHG